MEELIVVNGLNQENIKNKMEEKVLEFITTIRASFGASIATYTHGNCYQLYEILKVVFPNSEPFSDGCGHVYTKIDDNFYDIRGKSNYTGFLPITDPERIKSLSVNKWTDERRKEFGMGDKKIKESRENENNLTEGEKLWKNHKVGDEYQMDGKPDKWKITYYPILEDGKTGEKYNEPRALVEKPIVGGTDFREIPLRYLTRIVK